MQKTIYIKNSKRLWKYIKTKQKTTAFQRKCIKYILYGLINVMILKTVSFLFENSFFPLLSILECYKPNRWRMFYFLQPPLHSTRIAFASFGNLVNVPHDYQSIQVGSSSQMDSTLVLLFSGLDGIELGLLKNLTDGFRSKRYAAVGWSIRSTRPLPLL